MDFLASILKLAPSLISDFGGKTSAPMLKQQKQLQAQQQAYAQALADPNSSTYQSLYGQYQDQNRQNLAESVAEIQRQNRSAQGMGRGFLDSERGSEGLFRSLMKGYQDSDQQSHTQTRASLTNAMNGLGTSYNTLGDLSNSTAAANSQQLSGFDTIANILKGYKGADTSKESNGTDFSQLLSQLTKQPTGYRGY